MICPRCKVDMYMYGAVNILKGRDHLLLCCRNCSKEWESYLLAPDMLAAVRGVLKNYNSGIEILDGCLDILEDAFAELLKGDTK